MDIWRTDYRPAGPSGRRGERGHDALRAMLEARYARLQAMLNEWGSQLPATDWRIRLLHKALYSTWADLRQLSETAQGQATGERTRIG